MGGTGGGLVYNVEELEDRRRPRSGRLVRARGARGGDHPGLGGARARGRARRQGPDKITVCFIENIDPMGVHTGDSVLRRTHDHHRPRECRSACRRQSYQGHGGRAGHRRLQRPVCARPRDRPRSSSSRSTPVPRRSSALASKATGFPIALISAHAGHRPAPSTRSPAASTARLDQYDARRRLRGASSSRAGPSRSSRASEDKLGTQMTRRGRGHEHRQDLQGGLPEGHPLASRPAATAWASPRTSTTRPSRSSLSAARVTPPASASSSCTRPCARALRWRSCTSSPRSRPSSSSR